MTTDNKTQQNLDSLYANELKEMSKFRRHEYILRYIQLIVIAIEVASAVVIAYTLYSVFY